MNFLKHIMTPDDIGVDGSNYFSWIYHPDEDCNDGKKAGDDDILYVNEDRDVIAYAHNPVNYDVKAPGSVVSPVPDIEGAWTFQGVYNETAFGGAGIQATQTSAEDYEIENTAVDTDKNDFVDYQVEYGDRAAEGGCSGAPWVDSNGDLVSMHNGWDDPDGDDDPDYDIGCVGNKVLETVVSQDPPQS